MEINRYISPAYENQLFNMPSDNTYRVCMFFSIDLVNSTKFKSRYPQKWGEVIYSFYDHVIRTIQLECPEAEIWKHNGDDIIFRIEITNKDNILMAPSTLHKAMQLAYGKFTLTNQIAKNFLYFKGALWLANIAMDGFNDKEQPRNFLLKVGIDEVVDYVGIDIDEGFRMSQHAMQGKVVLDPKIVYLLNKYITEWRRITHQSIDMNVRIVDYKSMKGIWDEKLFPIVWYTDRWEDNGGFLYDERYTNASVKAYFEQKVKDNTIKAIEQVFNDLGFPLDVIKEIETVLEKGHDDTRFQQMEKVR